MKLAVAAIAAALTIASATLASASATNWTLQIRSTDLDNHHYQSTVTIGTSSGYTDGVDGAKGETGYIPPMPPNSTMATTAVLIPGASKEGILDLRQPLYVERPWNYYALQSWDVHIYTSTDNGPAMDKVKVTITPGTGSWAPYYGNSNVPANYTFRGSMVPGGVMNFDAANLMPASFSFIVDNPGTSFATASILTVTVGAVPEPSGVLALFSGVAGLAGFAWRRRK